MQGKKLWMKLNMIIHYSSLPGAYFLYASPPPVHSFTHVQKINTFLGFFTE